MSGVCSWARRWTAARAVAAATIARPIIGASLQIASTRHALARATPCCGTAARHSSTRAGVPPATAAAPAEATSPPHPCPLCHSSSTTLFAVHPRTRSTARRESHQCDGCALVFVPRRFHLTLEQEKQRYDTHRNEFEDQGYKNSLMKLVAPLAEVLKEHAQPARDALVGLDHGCGPNPVLSALMEQHHPCRMEHYDPFFHPNDALLARSYDFITSNEAAEHFCTPRAEFERWSQMVRPGGFLAVGTLSPPSEVMQAQLAHNQATGLVDKDPPTSAASPFARWWYARDLTHVTFYSSATWAAIEERWGWQRVRWTDQHWIGRKVVK